MEQAIVRQPDLQDESKFVYVPNVPILDNDEDDNLKLPFLKDVVKATNQRVDEGELVILTIGHTNEDGEEIDQPPIVGYGRNLQLGEFKNKPCILADFYFNKDTYEESMTFPRRSVELYHDKARTSGYIDIVSLLRRAPARDLGLLTLRNRDTRSIYIYPPEEDGDYDIMKEITKDDLDKLSAALVARQLEKEKDEEEVKKEDECKTKKSKEDEKSEDEVKHAEDCMCKSCKSKEDDKDDEKEDMEMAAPSGTNTFVPGVVEEKKAKKMRADSERITVSRLEKRLDDVQAERDLLVLRLRRVEREKDLKQLEAEGFQFDAPEELAHVETLDENNYALHMSRARKLYRRYPTGQINLRIAEPEVGATTMNKEKTSDVIKFAMKHNISDFSVALDRYNKEIK